VSTPEEDYPYATLDRDGYELEPVELDNWQDQGFLENPVPADDERFNVQEGDIVKLIFHYAKPLKVQGKFFDAEHMWVVVTSTDKDYLTGFLDNEPHYTKILSPGAELNFHPEHIVDIWRGE
jgi:hypothetical protein